MTRIVYFSLIKYYKYFLQLLCNSCNYYKNIHDSLFVFLIYIFFNYKLNFLIDPLILFLLLIILLLKITRRKIVIIFAKITILIVIIICNMMLAQITPKK